VTAFVVGSYGHKFVTSLVTIVTNDHLQLSAGNEVTATTRLDNFLGGASNENNVTLIMLLGRKRKERCNGFNFFEGDKNDSTIIWTVTGMMLLLLAQSK
jgi:hypothetical protein